jgi:hypothetical protein
MPGTLRGTVSHGVLLTYGLGVLDDRAHSPNLVQQLVWVSDPSRGH